MTGLNGDLSEGSSSLRGGFNVANSVTIGLVALCTLCILTALCYSIYYHQAKLKLRRMGFERTTRPRANTARLGGIEPDLEADIISTPHNLTAPPACITHTDQHTVRQSSNTTSLPNRDSGAEHKSTNEADTKMKTVMVEDKTLGRCEDVRPIRQTHYSSSVEMQLYAFRSSRT